MRFAAHMEDPQLPDLLMNLHPPGRAYDALFDPPRTLLVGPGLVNPSGGALWKMRKP
jgi:hypothetical protein